MFESLISGFEAAFTFTNLAFIFAGNLFIEIFQLGDLPVQPVFLHLSGVLIFVFGLGYYRVGQNPSANKPIIWMGVIGKVLVFTVILIDTLLGQVNWPLMIPASADLIFGALFYRTLKLIK